MHRIAICCFLFIAYASPATPHPVVAHPVAATNAGAVAKAAPLPAGSYSLSGLVRLTAATADADAGGAAVRFGAFILPVGRGDAGQIAPSCREPEPLARPSLGRLLSV